MATEKEKAWLAAWRYAGPRLDEIRRRELRELDDDEALRLLGARSVRNAPRPTTGLVEFQQWMMRLRDRLEKSGRGGT